MSAMIPDRKKNNSSENDDSCRRRFDRFYTPQQNGRQTYDLVIPENASGSTGLVLCIHGGGWVEGSKDVYTGSLLKVSGEKGCAAACMNYRYVSETVSFEDVLDDVSSALAAIKEAGATYGVDFDRVLLTGISAGGHISLLYAYTRKAAAPIKPVGVVELCGPTDFADGFYYSNKNSVNRAVGPAYFRNIISNGVRYAVDPDDLSSAAPALLRCSPVSYVTADAVPTVFGHGEQDTIVPYQNALDLDAALRANGVEHTFVSFPDSGHGCEDKQSMKKMMDLFFGCIDRYLK
ncbi:MAG: alpha/beta hydrolase [Clostridia bacterium]|nr:alpha/beta hydrolase [Clostridia bacterium]